MPKVFSRFQKVSFRNCQKSLKIIIIYYIIRKKEGGKAVWIKRLNTY